MRVTIDREECTSCEVCWTECPEVFAENEDDALSQIVQKYQVNGNISIGEVPNDLRDVVELAADGCPVEVIHVED